MRATHCKMQKPRFAAGMLRVYTPHFGFESRANGANRNCSTYANKTMQKLQSEIERFYASGSLSGEAAKQARQAFQEFRETLTQGQIRAAEKHDGQWRVNAWVKQGILLGFRLGELE